MTKGGLSRRQFLKGAGGAAVALPFLPAVFDTLFHHEVGPGEERDRIYSRRLGVVDRVLAGFLRLSRTCRCCLRGRRDESGAENSSITAIFP